MSDCVVETKLTAREGNLSGLALRADSITNYMRFCQADTGEYRLEKVVAGRHELRRHSLYSGAFVVLPGPLVRFVG